MVVADKIAQAIIKDKEAFEHLKNSMAWRLTDVVISESLNIEGIIKSMIEEHCKEILVLSSELRQSLTEEFEKQKLSLKKETRAIVIEQLPKCMDLFFAEEEQ